jgi:hypothetical protein
MPHTAQGLVVSRIGHPTDSKRSRSATANCGLYRSVNAAVAYCPARSHLLHAIANASVRATMSASVGGQDLQVLHLGGSSVIPHQRLSGGRVSNGATFSALLPRHDGLTCRSQGSGGKPNRDEAKNARIESGFSPGGRWVTVIDRPVSLAKRRSSRFQSLTFAPLLPPQSAVITNRVAFG